jgi:hypothetical protein
MSSVRPKVNETVNEPVTEQGWSHDHVTLWHSSERRVCVCSHLLWLSNISSWKGHGVVGEATPLYEQEQLARIPLLLDAS